MRPYFLLAILNPVTLFSGEYQGMVVLHFYAISAHQLSCGYEDFPPDMSKRVISAIKITDPFFACRWARWGYMLMPNLVTLAYPFRDNGRRDNGRMDGRRTTLDCKPNLFFEPSGLKTNV